MTVVASALRTEPDGPARTIVLAVFLLVAQLNMLQWQVVGFLSARYGWDRLIGTDRSIEVLAWAVVAVVAIHGVRPTRGPTRDAVLLTGATAVLLTVHGGITVLADGPTAAPLRPLAILLVLAVAARLGAATVAAASLAAALVGLLGTLWVTLVGWEAATRMPMASRLPGPSLLGPERVQGLYPHPNNAGGAAVLAIIVALALLPMVTRRVARVGLVVVVLAAGLVLNGSDSLTAAAALAVALLARATRPLVRHLPTRARTVLAVTGGSLVTAAPLVLAARLDGGALTGRVHVWQEVIGGLTAAEWRTGVGPGPLLPGAGLTERLPLLWSPGDAHSTVIELLLVAGVAGLIVHWLFAVVLLRVALATSEVSGGWSLAVAVLPLVIGLAEVTLVHGPADGRDLFLVPVGLLLAWSRDHGPATASSSDVRT